MGTDMWQAASLLTASDGRPLLDLGGPAHGIGFRLLGKPVFTTTALPPMATTGTATDVAVVVGDFRLGYMIAQRQGSTCSASTSGSSTRGSWGC